jgi:succinate dehydrogenase/fumarate reductase flavoprotein subunit
VSSDTADLVVMGAGAAGLAAAARGAQLGLRVVVLEAADAVGGSAACSNGNLWAPLSIEAMHGRGAVGDFALASRVVEDYSTVVAFVEGLGAMLDEPTASADGVGTGRFMDLPRFMEAAVALVEASGGAVRTGVKVDELLRDGRSVTGLAGGRESVKARSVVLAGGGFQGSKELTTRYIHPNADKLLLRSNEHSVGTGMHLAFAAGAVPSKDLDGFYGHLVCWPIRRFDAADFMDLAQYYSFQGLLLGVDGKRFTDESLGDSVSNQMVLRLPDAKALLVCSDATRRNPGVTTLQMPRFDKFELAEKRGANVASADTPEKLAAAVAGWGFDAAGVRRTLADYDVACAAGAPLLPPRRAGREALEPPLHAMEVRPSISNTNGGAQIDAEGRAIGYDRRPIDGLFAAGVDGANAFGKGYGGGLAAAFAFGLRAAAGAAERG